MSLYFFACALVACDSVLYVSLSLGMLFPCLLIKIPFLHDVNLLFPHMFRPLRPVHPTPPSSCDTDDTYASPPDPGDDALKTLATRLLAHLVLVHGVLRLATCVNPVCSGVHVCNLSLALEACALCVELLCTDAPMLHRTMFVILKNMLLIFVCLVGKLPVCL